MNPDSAVFKVVSNIIISFIVSSSYARSAGYLVVRGLLLSRAEIRARSLSYFDAAEAIDIYRIFLELKKSGRKFGYVIDDSQNFEIY